MRNYAILAEDTDIMCQNHLTKKNKKMHKTKLELAILHKFYKIRVGSLNL